MELEQERKKVIFPIINTLRFDNFLPCPQEEKKDLYVVQW